MWVVGEDGEKIEFESPFVNLEEVIDVLLTSQNPFTKGLGLSMQGRPLAPDDKWVPWAHQMAIEVINSEVRTSPTGEPPFSGPIEKTPFSGTRLMEIVQKHQPVFQEIEAIDTEFRRDLSSSELRETPPWIMMGRKRLRDEEFIVWLKLDASLIDDHEAIRAMLALMQDYYGRSLDSQ